MGWKEREEGWAKAKDEVDRILNKFGIKPPRCGFSIGMGWMPVVEEALEKMIAAGWDKQLDQVKQKFTQLRIYIGFGGHVQNENGQWILTEVGKIAEEAERRCDELCEECGQERQKKGMGVGRALCDQCLKEEE